MERAERFAIELELSGEAVPEEVLKDMMPAFGVSLSPTRPGDTLHLSYDFNIEYYNIVRKLDLLLKLAQHASIVKVSTKELNYGKSLIQELLCKLEQVEKKYNSGKDVSNEKQM